MSLQMLGVRAIVSAQGLRKGFNYFQKVKINIPERRKKRKNPLERLNPFKDGGFFC